MARSRPLASALDLGDGSELESLRRRVTELEELAAEQERRIAALSESEQRFRTICDHAPVMINVVDERGRILLWNRECERVLGHSREEVLAMEEPFASFYPEAAERDRALGSVAAGDGQFREFYPRAQDGTTLVQMWANFRLPNGALISVGHDVTAQRAVEAQLRQAQRLESVGQLTGGIAHDFNNLLTVVLSCADLLERRLPDHEGLRGPLDELRGAARRGEELIRKLLAFSRKEPRKLQRVDVGKLVRELAPTLRRLLPESIEMQLSTDVSLPMIEADAGAIEQLLVNLVTNARDAMPWRGSLGVETRVAHVAGGDGGAPGTYLVLSVSDTGTGMDEATRQRVFEPFFTTKPPGEGTGLGLAIVYGLVRQHGGFIDIKSTKGKGTTVEVFLSVPDDQAIFAKSSGTTEQLATVLVVEDNAAIRRVARVALEDEGYAVLVAGDGIEALRVLDEREVDLVVSDIVMPGLSGPELYRELSRGRTPPRFLFTSGYTSAEHDEAASDLGVPLLRKPWSVVDLLDSVQGLLPSR